MPYSNGLNRNIAQCLNDYNIPLYLSRSVLRVEGRGRVEKVVLAAVDEKMKFIPGTEMEFECDTLLLSVGLIPYVSLLDKIDVKISSTRGAEVNDQLETNIPGIFACGNCLHVHDVVDFVTDEGRDAGRNAASFIKGLTMKTIKIKVVSGNGVGYVIPQFIETDLSHDVTFKFRVRKPVKNVFVNFKSNEEVFNKVVKPVLIPSEMVMIKVSKDKLANVKGDSIEVSLEERL